MCATLAVRTDLPLFALCRVLYHQHHHEAPSSLINMICWNFALSLSLSLLTGDLFILKSRHKDTRRWLLAALRWSERGGKGKKGSSLILVFVFCSLLFISFSCHRLLFKWLNEPLFSLESLVCCWSLKSLDLLTINLSIYPFIPFVESRRSLFYSLFFVCWKVYVINRSIMSMIASNKSECRKVRKPKIEKLRRARINSSLEALKEILLRNTVSIPQGSRPTKLEKADILEMTVRYVELLHDKLSISSSCEVSARQSMETTGPVEWVARRERAFGDITNQTDKRHRQTTIVTDDKAWFNNRFHRLNSRSTDDKENLTVVLRRQNQSMLGEHWRPWW